METLPFVIRNALNQKSEIAGNLSFEKGIINLTTFFELDPSDDALIKECALEIPIERLKYLRFRRGLFGCLLTFGVRYSGAFNESYLMRDGEFQFSINRKDRGAMERFAYQVQLAFSEYEVGQVEVRESTRMAV